MPGRLGPRRGKWGETQQASWEGGQGYGQVCGQGCGMGSMTAFSDALAPWREQLDERAMHALEMVGAEHGTHILNQLSVEIGDLSEHVIQACRQVESLNRQ